MNGHADHASLPGEELVRQGLADLAQNRVTDCSLLVLIAGPRLKRLGIRIKSCWFRETPEELSVKSDVLN